MGELGAGLFALVQLIFFWGGEAVERRVGGGVEGRRCVPCGRVNSLL